ncbi:hypothetical protein NC652_017656 [Populus alba x Populus x berolinensis]|nr:hypothetical protein NC652_017656 [Populus alba x Populus x berolinensis]
MGLVGVMVNHMVVGVYLSPTIFSLMGWHLQALTENGIRHMLLCNVLMGKMEVIPAGSKQMYPSSEEFDTVSFKVPSFHVLLRNQISELKKHGPISVAALFPVLVKFLGPTKKALMAKIFDDLRKCKITRLQLVKSLRRVVGDDQLLIAIIESYRDKLAVRKHQAVQVGQRQQLI